MSRKSNFSNGEWFIVLLGVIIFLIVQHWVIFLIIAIISLVIAIILSYSKKKTNEDNKELYNQIRLENQYTNLANTLNKVITKKESNKYISIENEMEKIDNLTGKEFEDYIVNLLKEAGYTNIRETKSSGDYGVDIIAIKDEINCAIQCKRFSNKVAINAIQEIVAGRKYYKCDKAIVITNNYYTEPAKRLAESNNVELLDRDYIIRTLKTKEAKLRVGVKD